VKVSLDTTSRTLHVEDEGGARTMPLYSAEAFAVISRLWVKVGWTLKYTYTFSWMGRPVIQLPEDLVRIQELIFRVRPDVVVETGVAHGGSLVFYASLFRALGRGRVIGVDAEVRPSNRAAIEAHALAPLITLVEGDSVAPATVARVRAALVPGERPLVVLDSSHTRAHVLAELEAYAPLVAPGSYAVVTDGIMADLHDVPRGQPGWRDDNPGAAAAEFARRHPEFALEEPSRVFDDGLVGPGRVTYWPGGFLRRLEH
jgi:cephalosporin hydroxylase